MNPSFNFTYESDEPISIKEFTCKCNKCGSLDITLSYDFTYYSAATGYDLSLNIKCNKCETMNMLIF